MTVGAKTRALLLLLFFAAQFLTLKTCFVADSSEAVLIALVTLLLLGLAIACFIGGWLAPELVALLAAGLLMATGVLTPNEA